jgi:hypothetical protein
MIQQIEQEECHSNSLKRGISSQEEDHNRTGAFNNWQGVLDCRITFASALHNF